MGVGACKRHLVLWASFVGSVLSGGEGAQLYAEELVPESRPSESHTMDEVVVVDKRTDELTFAPPLPDVEDGRIYAGKKTTVSELDVLPSISTNNYRQVAAQLPGLLTSEVSNESFPSFSYRGLGDPHETFNLNLLRNGIPIAADMYGYPANYYQPPVDSIRRVEFVRGGASLLYGPQVGGALNFISRTPDHQSPASFYSKQVFGERNLFSTYNEMSGKTDNVSYIGFFSRRQSDGFRDENADYYVNNGNAAFSVESSPEATWSIEFDAYDANHGEAGGLTLETGPDLATYGDNRYQTTTKFDRLEIQRYAPTVGLEYEIDPQTTLYVHGFGWYYNRYSHRQSPGTAPVFGGIYNGETNTIIDQQFKTFGTDARISHTWDLNGEEQNLSAGALLYAVNSPFTQKLGAMPYADDGEEQRDVERKTRAFALFAENRFNFGRFEITPGARLENIYTHVHENIPTTPEIGLRDEDNYVTVLLPGLGASYDLGDQTELYANASTGYKPKTYQDTVPLNTGDTISNNLDPARSVMYEVGVRGTPIDWLRFDTSTFYGQFRDQFGRIGSNIQNVGDSRSFGVDLGGEFALLRLVDDQSGTNLFEQYGDLNFYWNASLLNAEFTNGPADGKTPQYAPNYIMRTGVLYNFDNRTKVAFMGTFIDDHYADDGNTDNRYIPAYRVWDLTAETEIIPNFLSLVAGINNVFDEKYYARIRSNGIDPGLTRNVYGGFEVKF